MQAITNCKAFVDGRIVSTACVVVEGQKIKKIARKPPADCEVFNAKGLLLLPALIDSHVHFREPGQEYKEGWITGSRAAAKGGVAAVLDMPNTKPATTTVKALELKRGLAGKKSVVDYGFHFGGNGENFDEVKKAWNVAAIKLFLGHTTGAEGVDLDEVGTLLFGLAKAKAVPALVHAENEALIAELAKEFRERGKHSPKSYSASRVHAFVRNSFVAVEAVSQAVGVTEKAGNKLYIAHSSTLPEVELVKKAKQKGLRVFIEVTPHHLFLTKEFAERKGNYGKVNPPLRSKKDQAGLWKAVLGGTVDTIATDHAPHLREEKEKDYWSAPSGLPGIETMLPLLLDAANKKRISLKRVVELTSENPAKIFGIKGKGGIKQGNDADFVLVDLNLAKKVRADELETKCKWSPFEGKTLKGWPVATWVRGSMVFDGENVLENRGKEVAFRGNPG